MKRVSVKTARYRWWLMTSVTAAALLGLGAAGLVTTASAAVRQPRPPVPTGGRDHVWGTFRS